MTELLAPAGDLLCAKTALYNGADAIYCACEHFGARAYAKNLTLDELKTLLILAHSLNKKVYVTVNTIVKDTELEACKKYVNELYMLGVDGLILADFAMINYVINNLKGIEAHISTQCGIKCLNDVRFFEEIGVDRVVLARENSFDEIKLIKENSKMPLEIFAHGALCVCYSGGCLMSSFLTQRSGNRGRCSQNCRREYQIFKDGQALSEKGFHLSMKDLNTSSNVKELVDINIDSLKLEGRMKNPDYVKIITSEYRKKIDDATYKPNKLSSVFHRAYTEGFIFDEDRGNIVDIKKKNNEGEFVAKIIERCGDLTKINASKELFVKDRIRIEGKDEDYYFTIDKIYKNPKDKKEYQSGIGEIYINIYGNIKAGNIFRMVNSQVNLEEDNTFKKGIIIKAIGSVGTPLTLLTTFDGRDFSATSSEVFQSASKKPIDYEILSKHLSKLNNQSLYLEHIDNKLKGDLFMSVGSINETRRNLMDQINTYAQGARVLPNNYYNNEEINYEDEDIVLCAFCTNKEQYETLKDLGIKDIYFENYVPYVDAKFKDINEDYILAGNYGALYKYKDKTITADYSFNTINADAVYYLHKAGAKYVTVSFETSKTDLKNIYDSYIPYGNNPNLEMIVYGKENLMTTKYCPLKRYGQCGICNQHKYYLADEKGKFEIYHVGCITHIINEKPNNLIDDLDFITKYVKRLRLQFTNESSDEIIKIVDQFKERLNGSNKSYFDTKNNTRGAYKRQIL